MGLSLWLHRMVWLMLLAATTWFLFLFATNYGGCRADGTGQLVCFLFALFLSLLEAGVFIVVTVIKLITVLMP